MNVKIRSGHVARALAVMGWIVGAGAHAAEPTLSVVEFYNAPLNHYFMTADPNEQAAVDKGAAGAGWSRTGLTFSAHEIGASASAKSVCRFYSRSQNSHFYTADAAECEFVKKDAGWQYEGLVFAIDVPSAQICASGTAPVYRVYNNGFGKPVGSNHRFMPDLTVAQKSAKVGGAFEGIVFCATESNAAKRADAVRLLRQATFGPRFVDIDVVIRLGTPAWIDAQFTEPRSKYSVKSYMPSARPESCVNDTAQPLRADSYCQRDNYGMFLPQKEFWQHALNNPDQLRQRVAWAWSQFFVISGSEISMSYGMLDYQQMLRDNAFANFATLLKKVTLHPAMGAYLDMANNQKRDPVRGIEPNENYAREILQLFSIGTNELNLDGTAKLDAAGRTIPTYDMEEIEGYAYVFTGWTFPAIPGTVPNLNRLNARNWAGVMEIRENFHDVTSKELLDGVKTQAGLTAAPDLDVALKSIFEHRNVPPFVSRFLIQRLVTGDPSPEYVERVAKVFQNNGAGVRGDIQAVTKAILLDPEARGAAKFDETYGQLNEPVLHIAQMARALNVFTDGFYFQTQGASMGQNVFVAPSVFNYFPPDHVIASNGVNAPEFGILNTTTTLSRINFANAMLMGNNINPSPQLFQATGTQFDWSAYSAVAASADTLIDKIAEIVQGGPFAPKVREAIKTAVEAIPASDPTFRAKTAMYLVFATPAAQLKK